ncbi:IS110 family transposase [Luteimonas sp. A537]
MGKASLDLAVDGQPSVLRFANNRAGIAKLVKRLRAPGATRIVVEATGGYEEPLLEACCDAGLWIARFNPRQARAFANATGELAKTDDIDARILALMARWRSWPGCSPTASGPTSRRRHGSASCAIGCAAAARWWSCSKPRGSRRQWRLLRSASLQRAPLPPWPGSSPRSRRR